MKMTLPVIIYMCITAISFGITLADSIARKDKWSLPKYTISSAITWGLLYWIVISQ